MHISDDLEYLNDSKFFVENIKKYFSVANYKSEDFFKNNSRCNKCKISIEENDLSIDTNLLIDLDISEIPYDNSISDSTICEVYTREPKINAELNNDDIDNLLLDTLCDINTGVQKINNSDSDSDNSDSDSDSNSDCDSKDDNSEYGEEDEDEEEEEEEEEEEINENTIAYIDNYPIQMICMEK